MELPPDVAALDETNSDADINVVGNRTGPRWRARSGEPSPRRREQIIQAAGEVLCRDGYGGASLKEIAREAGVAPGLLHYYFQSKHELLLEVVVALQRKMDIDWEAALGHIDDPLERIVAALDRTAMTSVEEPGFMRLMFDLYSVSQTDEAIRAKIQEIRADRLAVIEGELRAVLGRLPAYTVVNPRHLAQVLAGAIDGIVLGRLVDRRDSLAAYHALKALLLSMIVTAHVATGQQPPMARLQELLERPLVETRPRR